MDLEKYTAVLQSNSSDEQALQLKIGADIKRSDLAVARQRLEQIRRAYPGACWLATYEEEVTAPDLQRHRVLSDSKTAQPRSSQSPKCHIDVSDLYASSRFFKIAIAHADANDMPQTTQAATNVIIVDPNWAFA